MLRFEDPQYLYLLALVPLLIVVRIVLLRQRAARLRRFGDPQLLQALMPDVSPSRREWKFALMLAAIALLTVILARPQMGTKISNEKRTGIEVLIAMDISNSMKATDVSPSRLQKSKMLVERMVDSFVNDKLGLVVFAGDAFVQLPITSDYVSAKMFLHNIDPSLIALQGTNIADALTICTESFTQKDEKIGRAIILITDGEDHEGGAIEAAAAAKKRGMRVYVLGVGSPEGAPIPDGRGNYMKDNAGEVVITGLNEDMCRQIAQAGGGAYIHVDNTNLAQKTLDSELEKLQKGEIESVVYSEYDEQFQAIGLLLLLVIIIETMILERKHKWLATLKGLLKPLTHGKATGLLLAVLLLPAVATAQTDRQYITQGNRHYRAGDFVKAEVLYRKALAQNAANPQALYNLGCALMMQEKDSAAIVQYERAAKVEKDKERLAKVYHNIGVICQNKQLYGDAIKAYQQSLRNNPKDDETRYNLALCKKLKKDDDQNQDQQNDGSNDQGGKNDKDQQDKDQKKDDNGDSKEQPQPQPQQDQMSKENAEQMLNAAIQKEKNTQQRMKDAMQQPQNRRLDKNW